MLMLWIVFIAITVAALALILVPLWRKSTATADRSAYDVEVYRDQLEELDRDVERGLIEGDDADAARTEISRRLLAADAAGRHGPKPISGTPRRSWIARGLVLAIPAMAALFYGFHGAPGLPGSPAAERKAAPTLAPATQQAEMIARISERLQRNPDDTEGWSHLGVLLMSARRYKAAAEALGHASELTPNSAGLIARYGEALSFAAQGTGGAAARKVFESALVIDPREPQAHFYLGLADYQEGRGQAALERWRALDTETPADAPWRAPLRAQIARLAKELGEAPEDRGEGAPGPSADDVAAASRMSGGDRQAMIRSMVARLAERLVETPDDADGWIRLGRSYKVLGETAKSRSAYAMASALRPNDVSVLSSYVASIADAAGVDATKQPEFNGAVAKILGLNPNHRTALWFAGLGARHSGNDAAAARNWRKLLALLNAGSKEHAELSRQLGKLGTK